jgi:Domain of unknown function (DUF4249)
MKDIITIQSILSILVMTSCEKVINYELNSSTPRYVIEGVLTNQPGQCRVAITKSVNFGENNTFPSVSDAMVIISDNLGAKDTLYEKEPGIYSSVTLQGIPGNTYTLNITIWEVSFMAISTMPEPVSLDSVYFSKINAFGGTQNAPVPVYKDPKNFRNYYRFVELVNGSKVDAIFVRNDNHNNGRTIKQTLIDLSENVSTSPGDSVQIQMMCIDANVYEYFFSLNQIAGSKQNASGTPANPISNITGGALGYFSAQTVQEKTIVVP